jgi:hypothetical protein
MQEGSRAQSQGVFPSCSPPSIVVIKGSQVRTDQEVKLPLVLTLSKQLQGKIRMPSPAPLVTCLKVGEQTNNTVG